MAGLDYESLQLMQMIFDDVFEKVSKGSRYKAPQSVHDTIERSIFAIAQTGASDAETAEAYARTKALTALAGLTP